MHRHASLLLAGAAALALASTASAAEGSPLARAREAHPLSKPLPRPVAFPGALVQLNRAEWVSGARPVVRITSSAAARIVLPRLFTRRAAWGLRYTSATQRTLAVAPGHPATFRDLGLPARPYRLAVRIGGRRI